MKAKKQSLDHGLKDKGFAWTRRIIALVSVLAIVVLPKLVAVYYPDVDVTEIIKKCIEYVLKGIGYIKDLLSNR